MKNSGGILRLFILIQIVIISVLLGIIIYRSSSSAEYTVRMDDCTSGVGTYANGSYYFDGSDTDSDSILDILKTPELSLKAGSYTLLINYDSTEDEMFRILNDYSADWIRYPTGYLRRANTLLDYDFELTSDLDYISVIIQYIPTGGSIAIHDIRIRQSTRGLQKILLFILAISLILDISYANRTGLSSSKNTVLALAGLTFMMSLPLSMAGIDGLDLPYSLNRMEGLFSSLISGSFPARMDPFILEGAGYPSSIYYGDIFLYFPALLRMAGLSILEAWKVFVFCLNALTVIIAYRAFLKISRNNKTALIMAYAYCCAPFHMEAVYYRAASGEIIAYAFLPLTAAALYEIYTGHPDKADRNRLSTILALSVSAVLCSHLLSTVMLCEILVIIALILYKKTFRRDILTTLLFSVLKVILISSFFIVPFLDYYLTVSTRIYDTVSNTLIPIQDRGAHIAELFGFLTFFDTQGRVPFCPDGIGLILIAAFLLGIVMWINKKADRVQGMCLAMTLLLLWVSSDLFPWDRLISGTGAGRILSQIQHPTRYINFAVLFGVITLFCVLRDRPSKHIRICLEAVIAFTLFSASVFTSQYESTYTAGYLMNPCDLNSTEVGNGEYAPAGTDLTLNPYMLANENNGSAISSLTSHGVDMTLECSDVLEDTSIVLPRYNYKYYHVYDEQHREYPVTSGVNNLISFELPRGYRGRLFLNFTEPWYWRLAELISLMALLIPAAKSIAKNKSDKEK